MTASRRRDAAWKHVAKYAWASALLTIALYYSKWSAALGAVSEPAAYFRAAPPPAAYYVSLFGSIAVMVILLCAAMWFAVARRWVAERRVFEAVAVLMILRFVMLMPQVRWQPVRTGLAFLACLVILAAIGRVLGGLTGFARFTLLLFSVLIGGQGVLFAWRGFENLSIHASYPLAATIPPRDGANPHIVWIVFDELDYELATRLRPANVAMPEFDRLRGESFSATDAHSPTDETTSSFPALTIGKRVYHAQPTGVDGLSLSFGKRELPASWKQEPSIFSFAHKRGLNSAVIGWHHPYCRVFNDSLADCFWAPNVDVFDSIRREFVFSREGVAPVAPGTGEGVETVQRYYEVVAAEERNEYRRILNHALRTVVNRNFQLVLVHWMIPHPPGLYDRRRDALEAAAGENYFDNLELADVTLGKIRRSLEDAGLWDQTTLVVTGDHPLRDLLWRDIEIWSPEEAQLSARRTDPRVPFIVHLPGQKAPLRYTAPFDTILTHDLVKGWLEKKNSTPESVAGFLDANRGRFPLGRPHDKRDTHISH